MKLELKVKVLQGQRNGIGRSEAKGLVGGESGLSEAKVRTMIDMGITEVIGFRFFVNRMRNRVSASWVVLKLIR